LARGRVQLMSVMLTVDLRVPNAPLPAVNGPSADE
jgi:hypothetical protein